MLVEVLSALPLAMLVLLASFSIFSMMLNGFDRLFQDAEQQFYARVLLDQLTRDVKESVSTELKNQGTVLCLKDKEGRDIRYYANHGQVYRASGGSSIPISENTEMIKFHELNNSTIQVDVEFKQNRAELFISSICTRKH